MRTNDEIWIGNHQSCAAIEISDTPGIVHRLIYGERQCRIARCLLRAWNAALYGIYSIFSLNEVRILSAIVELVVVIIEQFVRGHSRF